VYIGPTEELQVWKTHEPLSRTTSGESTLSEQEFSKRFLALTHRMVHRKASGETYKRLKDNSLGELYHSDSGLDRRCASDAAGSDADASLPAGHLLPTAQPTLELCPCAAGTST
jgi:hypothetical protein